MALEELNKEFRNQYENALSAWRKGQGYIIVATVSSVTLIYEGAELKKCTTTSKIYKDLKNVAHIPITVYLLIKNRDPLHNDVLEQYKQRLENPELLAEIEPTYSALAQKIVKTCQTILSQAINNRESVDHHSLIDFCRSLKNDLNILLEAAAIDQANLMNAIVQDWLQLYNIDKHNSPPKVLILSPRTARQNNLQAIYFEHLFGISRAREFFYIEDIFSEKTAIKIFSTWFYDEQIGDAFFNDPGRMYRDLLVNDNVRERIKTLIS